ncbi:MAG TPA: hypothetical protein VK787_01170 [Puia sp.]|jgi:hypothetical protein|nr:hypothetical protein [Puia sp.]
MSLLKLKKDDLPYVIVVIAGLLTWSLQHAVDRLLETPVVEYSIQQKSISGDSTFTTIRFSNITTNKRFDSLHLLIQPLTLFSQPTFISGNKMAISNSNPTLNFDHENGTISLMILGFQPEQNFELRYYTLKKEYPSIRYSIKDSVLYLSPPGLSTFLINNENLIILSLIILSSITLIIFIPKS